MRGGTGHQAGPARIRAQAASTQQAQGAGPRLDRALPSRARLKLLASPVVRLSGAGAGVELRGAPLVRGFHARRRSARVRPAVAPRRGTGEVPARSEDRNKLGILNKNVGPVNVNLAKYTLHASDPMIARTAAAIH